MINLSGDTTGESTIFLYIDLFLDFGVFCFYDMLSSRLLFKNTHSGV